MSWSTRRFSQLVNSNGIFTDGDWIESKDQDPNGGVRLVQLADIGTGVFVDKSSRFMTQQKADELKCTFLKKGDILIARMPDPIGRACIFPGSEMPCVTVVDICIVRPDPEEVDSQWLMHLINSKNFNNQICQFVTGTTRQRISRGNLSNLIVKFPPLTEQKRIAAILDKADAIRRKRQQAIKLADEFLRSVFWEMFGESENYAHNHPYLALDSVCTKITDGEHGTVKRIETGRLYLMARNIGKNNMLDMNEVSYISEEDHQKIVRRCNPELNDLLLVCVGATIGKVALVPKNEEFSLARSVALIKPNRIALNPIFLLHLFKSDWMQNKIKIVSNTSAQSGLYTGQIKSLHIPVPSMELQEAFSEIAHKVTSYAEKLMVTNKQNTSLFDSLSQIAFSGEL